MCHIDRDAHLRINPITARLRAAQANFFLHGGHAVHGALKFSALHRHAQRFHHHPCADFIIQPRRSDVILADLRQAELVRHRVADLHNFEGLFLILRADIDPQVDALHLALVAFFGLHEMDRLAADDAGDRAVLRVNGEVRAGQHGVIDPADGFEIDVAFVIDVIDHQPDLIHMPGEHDPRAFLRAGHHHHVAVNIGFDFVGPLAHTLAHDAGDGLLKAADAGGFFDLFQKIERFRSHCHS